MHSEESREGLLDQKHSLHMSKALESKGGGWGEGCDGWRGPSSILIHLLGSITGPRVYLTSYESQE